MSNRVTVSLETVFDAIPVGLGLVDPGRRIVLMNRSFRESLDLPLDAFPPGTPVEDAVRASALRGVYGPGDPDAQVAAVMAPDRTRAGRLRRRTFGGRTFDLHNTPLPDGSYIVSAVETTALLAARADAENALGQTASALSALRIGLAVFDSQRRLLLVNPRFSSLLMLPPDRPAAGTDFGAMLDLMATREEYANSEGVAFIAALRGAAPGVGLTQSRLRSDGRTVEALFDPLPNGGCAISISDITPQVRSEDDARRRALLLDMVLLNIPHGICVYGPDRRVTMVNDTYHTVMDGAPLRIGEVRAEIVQRRFAAGEYGQGAAAEAVRSEEMTQIFDAPHVRRRVRPNGTVIDVRTAPLPDGGHIRVVTDVSALVQAEAELSRRAAEMSTMLGNIRQGILLWDGDRRLVASNAAVADLLGLPDGLLVPGKPESDLTGVMAGLGLFGPPEDAAEMVNILKHLDRSVPFDRELKILSGRTLHAQSNPAPAGGWITTFTDITLTRETEAELRRSKDRAEAANQAKSRFLATMSHEFRTPLNAIIGFSESMMQDNGAVPADVVADYSGQINAAGKQLLSLINVVLDVARIESGRFQPAAESVDIATALRNAVRQCGSVARAGEVSVVLDIPGDLPLVRGDERRIAQTLSDLLSNAVKFTDAGGAVTARAGLTDDGDLLVSLTDTGIGIPGEDLERVFEPFTQLDETLARRYSGAGLGLFTARAVVVAHGGQLTLTSRVGVGTTVRIVLPRSRILPPADP